MSRTPWFVLLVGLLVGSLAGIARAERPALADPIFERVGNQGDITDDVVSALVMDPHGLLWIGTADGLVRYDGNEFRTLSWSTDSSRGTAFVRSLLAARDGRIWVGTDRDGLAGFDPRTRSWRFLRPEDGLGRGTVRVIAEDPQGRLWAGSFGVGLQRVNLADGQIERFGLEQGLPDLRVNALLAEPDGTVWAGTWQGLARLAPGGKRFELVALPRAAAVITALHRDRDARLWIGSADGDLWRFGANGGGVELIEGGGSPSGLVQSFADLEDGEIWVGRAAGLEIRRASDGARLRRLVQRLSQPWGLASSDVRWLLRDRSGLLWLGSYGGGLQRHLPSSQGLWVRQSEADEDSVLGIVDIRSMAEVRLPDRREIWLGTNARGVAIVDEAMRLRGALRSEPGRYPGGRAGGMTAVPGAQGEHTAEVWVASETVVAVFAADTRRWLRNEALGQGRVRTMLTTRARDVLAATQDGVYRWQPQTRRFLRLALASGKPLVGDINALAEEQDGTLWIGGERGLYRLAPGAEGLEDATGQGETALRDTTVIGLLVDARQQLWVDTAGGLHKRLPEGGFDWISARLGLGGKAFGANLQTDSFGRIWTHRGVFDPRDGSFQEMSAADGVNFGTGWFRSHLALSDGRLLFGGSKGLLVLTPERFKPWDYAAPLHITDLWLDGRAVPPARLQPSLTLSPSERSFSLRYAALDFSQPARNRYRYRLEGRDNGWIEASVPLVSYGGLPPGRYTLLLDGSNRNGVWAKQPLAVELEVQPAWWQTWWTRVLGLLLLFGMVGAWTQWRTRLLRQRRQELERRVQERTQTLEQLSLELAEKGRALAESALVDPLTGMHNRRFLNERIDTDLALSLRRYEDARRRSQLDPDDADLCCFIIDIDHFKDVNDRHGHAAGDAVLVQMRERLLEAFRAADYLVRWGGEEFLVVSRAGSRRHAAQLAERARQAVAQRPFQLPDGQAIVCTCSIGFACFPLSRRFPAAVSWSVVLGLANCGLYAAKRAGRNRWDGVLDADALEEAALPGRLGDDGRMDPRLHRLRGP